MNKLLLLGVFASIWGCSEEYSSSLPKYKIYFSEELSINVGEVGISSQVPFLVSPINLSNQSFLVFNSYFRRLDTVSFNRKDKRIVPGLEIPKEGAGSIPSFSFFTHTEQKNIFFSGNYIYFLEDGETVKLKIDDNTEILKSINGGSVINGVFQSAPYEGNYFSVIIKDNVTEEFSLIKHGNNKLEKIPFSFDSEQISKHRISFDFVEGSTVSNTFSPYLTVSDSTFIIAYPFMNKISLIGLDDLKQVNFLYESKLFKTQKDIPEKKRDFEDIAEFMEISSRWNKDVYYGSVLRLNDRLLYRIVFESQEESQKKFLELFDKSFEKVGEFDLTAIEPDLKWFHITVEGKILIQSSKDPDEDIFKYYLISVDQI